MKNILAKLTFIAFVSVLSSVTLAGPEEGRQLYEVFCTQCHGLTAEGNGINAPKLEVAPRNHTDRGEMIARTDEELFKAISEGGQAVNKSILMPNWGNHLDETGINDIIAYLREICCQK